MKISANKVASIHYVLKDDQGETIDSSTGGAEPLTYLHGNGQLIPGMENSLNDKAVGDKFSIVITPEDGYGQHNETLIQKVPRTAFPEDSEFSVGMRFQAHDENGNPHVVVVTEVGEEEVTVDGNHPLSGKTLHFDVEIIEVRDATEEEIQHGHAHGPGGHQH